MSKKIPWQIIGLMWFNTLVSVILLIATREHNQLKPEMAWLYIGIFGMGFVLGSILPAATFLVALKSIRIPQHLEQQIKIDSSLRNAAIIPAILMLMLMCGLVYFTDKVFPAILIGGYFSATAFGLTLLKLTKGL
jgi:hypothetical protein